MSRRDQVLEAAIRVTAQGGVRALTHLNVDREGCLPRGTTSNHFRSREALNVATLETLGAFLAARIGGLGSAPIATLDDMAAVIGAHLATALGPGREATGAFVLLFIEAAVDPSLRPAAGRTNDMWAATIAEMLRDVGVTHDVEARARWLLSYGTGLVVDQLAVQDEAFDPVAAMIAVLRGFGP